MRYSYGFSTPQNTTNDMSKETRFVPPKMDPMSRRFMKSTAEIERLEKQSEAARHMTRLALILDQTRSRTQILYRLRRKRCMKIVWQHRGKDEDALLNDMLKWLRKKVAKLDAKAAENVTEDASTEE